MSKVYWEEVQPYAFIAKSPEECIELYVTDAELSKSERSNKTALDEEDKRAVRAIIPLFPGDDVEDIAPFKTLLGAEWCYAYKKVVPEVRRLTNRELAFLLTSGEYELVKEHEVPRHLTSRFSYAHGMEDSPCGDGLKLRRFIDGANVIKEPTTDLLEAYNESRSVK